MLLREEYMMVPDPTSVPTGSLSEDVKGRIRIEEQFRMQLRTILEKEKKDEDDSDSRKKSGLYAFLSSKLGIVFLTAILVPTFGGLYTHMQQRANERTTENRQVMKLLAEFDWRLAEIEYQQNRIPNASNPQKWASAAYIWRAIVGNEEFATTLPEFQRIHLAGIVSQLRSLGYSDPNALAFKTIKDMESGGEKVPLPDQPPLKNTTFDTKVLNEQLKILQRFRTRIKPKTGLWDLLW
jgi:hypothetical protein